MSQSSMSGSNRSLGLGTTEKLIEEIGINLESISDCLNNWREMFKEYDYEALSPERKLLFYRDLRESLKTRKNVTSQAREINSIGRSLLIEMKSYSALYGLFAEKGLRKKFRKI
jgi:phenylalanyl-tRNA synthetase beta subunit